MKDTERTWYEAFLHQLLPESKGSEHGNSAEETDEDVELSDVEELLNDAKGG